MALNSKSVRTAVTRHDRVVTTIGVRASRVVRATRLCPRVLPRGFYEADPVRVGPLLLNKLLVRGSRVGRIVEVEAYRGSEDPASHAFRGPTRRNATMFGPPGHLYVYFTYGMHWCANVVLGPEGTGHAVLLRAVAPVSGLAVMRRARPPGTTERNLTSGPAKLCQAFGITGEYDGADLVGGDRGLTLCDDDVPPPVAPGVSGRIGIRQAADLPWRWWVPGDPHVTRGRPSGVPIAGRGSI
jgi:DNA-3-methyladenine glycosylase